MRGVQYYLNVRAADSTVLVLGLWFLHQHCSKLSPFSLHQCWPLYYYVCTCSPQCWPLHTGGAVVTPLGPPMLANVWHFPC